MARHHSSSVSKKHKSKRHKRSTSKGKRVSFEETPSLLVTAHQMQDHTITKQRNSRSSARVPRSRHRNKEKKKAPTVMREEKIPESDGRKGSSHHSSTRKKNMEDVKPARKSKNSRKKHPIAVAFSESIERKTHQLLTSLTQDLQLATSSALECILEANKESAGKSYRALASSLQASLLPKGGAVIPLHIIKQFQQNCKQWDQQLMALTQEYTEIQLELWQLAKDLGIVNQDDTIHKLREKGGPDGTASDEEFDELIAQIKGTGKTYVAKMEKMEKQMLEQETRQNLMMMQAL